MWGDLGRKRKNEAAHVASPTGTVSRDRGNTLLGKHVPKPVLTLQPVPAPRTEPSVLSALGPRPTARTRRKPESITSEKPPHRWIPQGSDQSQTAGPVL